VEGIGKESWPDTLDPDIIDRWITVGDRESFLMARRLTREEGLLAGGSCGTVMVGALEVARSLGKDDVVVVILPDSGRNYLSKIFNESWMLEHGFMERPGTVARIGEVLAQKRTVEAHIPDMVAVPSHQKVGEAIDILQQFGISQVPVARNGEPRELSEIIGSISERSLLDKVFRDRDAITRDVVEFMDGPLPVVQAAGGLEEMFADLSRGAEAIVVADGERPVGVLSRADLLEFLAHQTRA
jgi:cystathionine beta-synthase